MSQERYRRAKAIFLAASGQPDEQRAEFVRQACGDDAELLHEVESLIGYLDQTDLPGLPTVSQADLARDRPESIPGYRIIRRLGEGGMGVVYEAEQEGAIRRTVALKVIKRGLDSAEVVARFESERRALALMNHPAITQVFEAGCSKSGQPYFAMEYVAGRPITEYCNDHRLDIRDRLQLFLAVCSGVQHAHEKGIVHRDVKPSNILIVTVDGKALPKLIDFGIAKATEQSLTDRTLLTQAGQWVGTPDYMSPEQAGLGSETVDGRTDIYSLGVVLYELLTDSLPLDSQTLREAGFDEMRRIIREVEPSRPSTRISQLAADSPVAVNRQTDPGSLRRSLHGDLDWIVLKALEKSPDRRYVSVTALAADLERYLDNRPVEARAPTAVYRLQKLVQRRRPAIFTAGLVAVALVVGFASTRVWAPPEQEATVPAPERTRAEELYRQGVSQLNSQTDEGAAKARQQFEEAIALDPTFAPVHAALAETYIVLSRSGDMPIEEADRRAGEALETALRLDSELATAHSAVGLLHTKIGDFAAAETALRRAIELDPELAVAHLRLGNVLVVENRPAEAMAAFERAQALDPLDLRTLDAVASSLMNQGRYAPLALQFERRLRIEPDSAETYRLMAMFARTYGRLDDAARWAHRAVELAPDGALNLNELAMAYSILGDFEQATRWSERAYALAPNNHWAIAFRAFLMVEQGDFEALEQFTQLQLEQNRVPENAVLPQGVRVRLALAAMSKVYRGELDAAVELYERALGDSRASVLELGIDAWTFSFLAFAYQQLGREVEAAEAAQQARELISRRHDWIWAHLIMPEDLAAVQVLEGDDDRAVETLIEAFDDGWMGYAALEHTPHFEELRKRPEVQQLMRQIDSRRDAMRASLAAGGAAQTSTE